MVIVGRYINGITINPLEYIHDSDNNLMKFVDEDPAKSYLREHGVANDDMEWFVFESVDAEDGGNAREGEES